jgi:hypothetical protein
MTNHGLAPSQLHALLDVFIGKRFCMWLLRVAAVASIGAYFAGPLACGVVGGISLGLSLADRWTDPGAIDNWQSNLEGSALYIILTKLAAARSDYQPVKKIENVRTGDVLKLAGDYVFSPVRGGLQLTNQTRAWLGIGP